MSTTVTRVSKIEPQQPERSEHKLYRTNYLLLVLLVIGLFGIFTVPLLTIGMYLLSICAIYADARTLHAGAAVDKKKLTLREKFKAANHTPGAWAVLTLCAWVLVLPAYLYLREAIFHANSGA